VPEREKKEVSFRSGASSGLDRGTAGRRFGGVLAISGALWRSSSAFLKARLNVATAGNDFRRTPRRLRLRRDEAYCGRHGRRICGPSPRSAPARPAAFPRRLSAHLRISRATLPPDTPFVSSSAEPRQRSPEKWSEMAALRQAVHEDPRIGCPLVSPLSEYELESSDPHGAALRRMTFRRSCSTERPLSGGAIPVSTNHCPSSSGLWSLAKAHRSWHRTSECRRLDRPV
jgi:hypothetical protein